MAWTAYFKRISIARIGFIDWMNVSVRTQQFFKYQCIHNHLSFTYMLSCQCTRPSQILFCLQFTHSHHKLLNLSLSWKLLVVNKYGHLFIGREKNGIVTMVACSLVSFMHSFIHRSIKSSGYAMIWFNSIKLQMVNWFLYHWLQSVYNDIFNWILS